MSHVFTLEDQQDFFTWSGINVYELTWHGKYSKEFDRFWQIVFCEALSLEEIFKKISLCEQLSKNYTVKTWFLWLRDKFILYLFFKKKVSLQECSLLSGVAYKRIVFVLRGILSDKYPERIEEIENFFYSYILCEDFQKGDLYSYIVKNTGIKDIENGIVEDDILSSLEISLFENWREIYSKLETKTEQKKNIKREEIEKNDKNTLIKKILIYLSPLWIFLIIFCCVHFTKIVARYFEEDLKNKIAIYRPSFFNFVPKILFKENDIDPTDTEFYSDQFLKFEKAEDEILNIGQIDYDPETDILWSSETEESFESYRDSFGGATKIYRIFLNPNDFQSDMKKISELLEMYKAVNSLTSESKELAKIVPGGGVFDVMIPNKEGLAFSFLKEIQKQPFVKVYIGRARIKNNPEFQKFFIWVSEIKY